MPYTTINKSTEHFNTVTYSNAGDGAKAVTGVGFQPDLVWLKNRTVAYHPQIHDAVRGASNGSLYTSTTNAVDSGYPISSFDSDGFTTGSQSSNESQNSASQVAWNWKAGTTSGISGGTITPSAYSINTTSGFGIYQYTGTGSAGTIAHGLGKVPTMIIIKPTSTTGNWYCYHVKTGNDYTILLNSTGAAYSSVNWQSTTPTNSVFSIRAGGDVNTSGVTYLAYVFCDVNGYSKFGSYIGNANNDGVFVNTGFKPAFVMTKMSSGVQTWNILDNKRNGYNPTERNLQASMNNAEDTGRDIDLLSNGFKIRNGGTEMNGSGSTYIYMAFGQSLVGSNNVPCTAR